MNEQSNQQTSGRNTSGGEGFSEWAVVEVMGHQRYGGYVSEQTVGGASFVRVDVPSVNVRRPKHTVQYLQPGETIGERTVEHETITLPAMTKLFGALAIYCITPCTEEVARAAAVSCDREPVTRFDLGKAGMKLIPADMESIEAAEVKHEIRYLDDVDDHPF